MTDKIQTRAERRKRLQENKNKKKPKTKGIFKKIILSLLILAVVGLVAGIGTFAYYVSKTPELDEALLKDPISSKIYDKDGKLITEIGTEKRDYVNFDDIPDLVVDAVLATEDSRFYEHNGVDILRLGSAVIANFTDGFGSQGASTITQQLVKRSFLSDEKKLERKAQELWLSLQVERKYSKKEIFEMYINKIFYGEHAYGIATAAKTYFGKSLDELELHEAATLAGLPQSPSRYNPFKNPEGAENRRNTVLHLMNKHGYITETQMKEAKSISLADALIPEEERNKENNESYNSFVDRVLDEIEEKTNYNAFTDGLEIYTTLDPNAQEYVYKILNTNDVVNYPDAEVQAGITLLDSSTGAIRAIGGGRNQTVQRGINYATDIRRQPGSTIKPIVDYGPAIEYLKWSTYEQIVDEEHTYSDGTPIKNYNGKYHGQMSIRHALAQSYNIPALKALQAVGLEKSRKFAEGLGMTFKDFYESASIGGYQEGTNALELAGAYSAFANEGVYNEPYSVSKIVLADKSTTIDLTPESKVVMKDYTAFMITDMLKSVMTSGTGRSANVSGLPLAGKTGTTNYDEVTRKELGFPSSASPDSWMVGYTTQYTAAIWLGYEKQRENYLSEESQKIPRKLFKALMTEVSKGVTTKDFKKPSSVVAVKVEKGSDPAKLPSEHTPSDQIVTEYFVKGRVPTEKSATYKKLGAPTGLQAKYEQLTNEIVLNWNYPEQEDDEKAPSFTVTYSVDGGEEITLTSTSNTEARLPSPTANSTYKFAVTAKVGEQTSDPASIAIKIPSLTIDEEEEENNREEDIDDSQDNEGDNEDTDSSDEDTINNNNNSNNNDSTNNSSTNNGNNKPNSNQNANNDSSNNDENSIDSNNIIESQNIRSRMAFITKSPFSDLIVA